MKFSVIVINYNSREITKNCLDSLFYYFPEGKFEVIIVDNCSSDDSVNFLYSTFGSKIKLIKNDKNLGFARANNQAVEIAEGDYLFFLNSDTIIKENILKSLETSLQDKKIGAVSPALRLENNSFQKYASGRFPTLFSLIFRKFSYPRSGDIDWVSGAAMVIKRDVFKKVGGFDNQFFMYFEDVDICLRIKELDYKIIVDENVSLIHLGGKSIEKHKKRKRLYYESQNYFYKKNYGYLMYLMMKFFRFLYLKF